MKREEKGKIKLITWLEKKMNIKKGKVTKVTKQNRMTTP